MGKEFKLSKSYFVTVQQLMEKLSAVDPKRVVILASDAEMNGFHPLTNALIEGSYKNGEFGLENLTDEERKLGYTEEDIIKDGMPAVILVPVD